MQLHKLISLAIGLSCIVTILNAQEPTKDFVKYPLLEVQKHATVEATAITTDWHISMKNTSVVPGPLTADKQRFIEAKKQANALKEELESRPSALNSSSKTATDQPSIGENYFGPITGGTPNDNDIAINKGGKLIAVVNTMINMYRASSATPVVSKSLAGFAGVSGAQVSDPHVAYDSDKDRFVVLFLSGFTSATNKIVICFSATSDPFGAWNIYQVPAGFSNKWSDFPQVAIMSDEVIVTTNLTEDGSGLVSSGAVFQIDKNDGYIGASSLTVQTYQVSEVGLHPVQGGKDHYGPGYLIRTNNVPLGNTKVIFMRELTETIANGGTLSSPTTLNSDFGYSLPPDADQKGSALQLSTNSSAILGSYLANGKIQFANNTGFSGTPSIYYGTVTLSPLALSFSAVNGDVIRIDSFHISYPNIAFCGDDGLGNNKSLLFFDFVSANHFPGNACVYIDETGSKSDPVITKYGFSDVGGTQTSPARWGDYSGAAVRTNNVGEVWVAGHIGRNGSNPNGTWISQLFISGTPSVGIDLEVDAESKLSIYPNPAVDFVKFEFPVEQSAQYSIRIFSLEGKLIQSFDAKPLKAGEAFLSFNTMALPSGVFLVKVMSGKEVKFSKKLLVTH